MWIICLCGSSTYCFISIGKTVKSFFDHEVVTNIDIVSDKPSEFPAVTFCNLNPFVTDYAISQWENFRKMVLSNQNNINYVKQI